MNFDPNGKNRLTFLNGHSEIQQYRLLLSFYGLQKHGKDSVPNAKLLLERLHGTQVFIDTLNVVYGEVISPLNLTPNNFLEVVAMWNTLNKPKHEFSLLMKVAAWLSDLLVDDEVSPYHHSEVVKND